MKRIILFIGFSILVNVVSFSQEPFKLDTTHRSLMDNIKQYSPETFPGFSFDPGFSKDKKDVNSINKCPVLLPQKNYMSYAPLDGMPVMFPAGIFPFRNHKPDPTRYALIIQDPDIISEKTR